MSDDASLADPSTADVTAQLVLIRRCWLVATYALFGATWPLWTPEPGFPQVPLASFALQVPPWAEWCCLAVMLAALLVALLDYFLARFSRAALFVFAAALAALFVLNQHRLQPWAYEAWLFAVVLASLPARRALALLRWLTISIYCYSALSKFDYTFLHSLGPQFVAALLKLGGNEQLVAHATAVRLAWLFPLGELAVAVLLIARRTRRLGAAVAIAMHVLLLLILGPLGLDQQPGVLIWNLQFLVLAWLLFGRRAPAVDSAAMAPAPAEVLRWKAHLARAIVVAAMVLPLAEPLGYCDHWLAWGLYSPGASRAIVFVRGSDVGALPEAAQAHVAPAAANELVWRQVRLDRWSLEALRAPLYPQARFQLGAALALARHLRGDAELRIDLYTAADRWTGRRLVRSLTTRQQQESAAASYWINAQPEHLR